jgi:hypothetical protein
MIATERLSVDLQNPVPQLQGILVAALPGEHVGQPGELFEGPHSELAVDGRFPSNDLLQQLFRLRVAAAMIEHHCEVAHVVEDPWMVLSESPALDVE